MLFNPVFIFALSVLSSPAPSPNFIDDLAGPPVPPNCKNLFQNSVYDCGSPDDILHINQIAISPFPPKKGQKLVIKGDGEVSEDIVEGSTANVIVKYGFIKLLSKKVDLCQELKQIGLNCPLKKGNNKINIEVDIPKEVPPGKYMVDAVAHNFNNKTIGHLQVRIEFKITN